jgi:hypothetical protein
MLLSIRQLCRYRVEAQDRKLGKADDFYFDEQDWRVRYMVVNDGRWLPSNRTLVPASLFGQPDTLAQSLKVEASRDELSVISHEGSEQPRYQREEEIIRHRYGGSLYRNGGGHFSSASGMVATQALDIAEAEATAPSRPVGGDAIEPRREIRSAREIMGYHIEALDGPVGICADFLVDDDGWEIRYLMVNTKSWKPGRRVLIPRAWVEEMSWAESRIHMKVGRQKLKTSARYDPPAHTHTDERARPFLWP